MSTARAGLIMTGVLALVMFALGAMSAAAAPSSAGDPVHGKYIFEATGACGCHGPDLAGYKPGAPREQSGEIFTGPFGSVTAKNITPDKDTGIGGWADDQIIGAIRNGIDDQGLPLFPIMPYTTYHFMSNSDVRDLVAYLRTVPAVKNDVPDNSLKGPVPPPPALPPSPATAPTSGLERGRYLVSAVSDCGSCHTPSLPSGAPDRARLLAGSTVSNQVASNLTPDKVTGIGNWTDSEVAAVLRMGLEPEGTSVQGLMGEVVHGTPLSGGGFNQLTDSDLRAIIAYLRSIPAVSNTPATGAGFRLGFKAMSDMLPSMVGIPLDNEHVAPNGDTVQDTTGGLLVWRKSDGVVTFTDGSTTWLNGPDGLQKRPNGTKLSWEH